MRRSCIPYDRVPGFRTKRIFLDYVAGEEAIGPFLPPLLRGDKEIRERVDRLGSLDFPREALADRLHDTNVEMGAAEATLAGIDDLRRGANIVVTGQQPGLLTGPLYTIYKALGACLLARHVEEKGFGRTVPVFWCASEDHDLAEANRIEILDEGEPQRISLELEDRRASLSEYEIDPMGGALLDRLGRALRRTEFTEDLFGQIASWMRGGFGGWFSRMMLALFREYGLVLVEPREVRDLSAPFVEREIRNPTATGDAIRQAGQDLRARGYEPLLTGDEGPGLFVTRQGARERVRVEQGSLVLKGGERLQADALLREVESAPDRFSLGVALRPIVQDGIFPCVAMVAGPSEVGYLAQLGEAYRNHGVERPPLIPRISLTLVEGKVDRVMERLSISPDQVFGPAEEMRKAAEAAESASGGADGFLEARAAVDRAVARIEKSLPDELSGVYPRMERRIRKEMDRIQGKVEEAERRRQGLGKEQIRKIENGITPFGKIQERVWGIVPFLNRYGPGLLSEIAGSVDLFAFEHQWLYLARQVEETAPGPTDR